MAGRRAHARQPAQLRADQKRVDTAGQPHKLRVMQHHAAIVPHAAGKERVHLSRRKFSSLWRSRNARRRVACDPPAPWIGGLRDRAAPRIGQRIACGHIHHHERIEGDLQPACLQFRDQMQHARIRRCAAEGRPAIRLRNHISVFASHSLHRPHQRRRRLRGALDTWPDHAMAGAQIGAKPGDDDGHAREVRAHTLQIVECCNHIGGRRGDMPVLRRGLSRPDHLHHGRRFVTEFRRARNQRHRPRHRLEQADRPHHLE